MILESCLQTDKEIVAIFDHIEEYDRDVRLIIVNKDPQEMENLDIDWEKTTSKPNLNRLADRFRMGEIYECFEYNGITFVLLVIEGLQPRHLDAFIDKYSENHTSITRLESP